MNTEDGVTSYAVGSDQLPRSGVSAGPEDAGRIRTTRFSILLYSEEQLLANQKPNIDPSVFRDKIVFVGVTAAGLSTCSRRHSRAA